MYIVKIISTGEMVECGTKARAEQIAARIMMVRDQSVSIIEDRPEPYKQYRLTGGPGVKSIANRNSWSESLAK